MPDEKLPLTLPPGSGLALVRPQGGRIVREMVDGALANARQQDFSVSDEKLTPELWFQRGEAHYYGHMAIQSFEEAARCYRIATEHGHLDAACNLGCLLTVGLGVAKDPAGAARLFENAAGRGHPVGWLNLSYLYEVGIGVTIDRLKAEFGHYLGMNKNDPTHDRTQWRFRRFRSFNPSSMVPGAGVALTDDMVSYDYSFQSDPKRTNKFITFYEVVLPTMKSLIRLAAGDELSILRKVRLEELACANIDGHIFVLDSNDSPLTCGDLLPLPAFESLTHYVWNEGGIAAEGLVCNPNQPGIQPDKAIDQAIVGCLDCDRIEIGTNTHCIADCRKIICSLYHRGLGVRQNDDNASRCHPEFSRRRTRIGDHMFCDPDYQQLLLWAKTLDLNLEDVIDRVITEQETEFGRFYKTLFSNGRITRLGWDIDLLPLSSFEWVGGLGIEGITFFVPKGLKPIERSMRLPLPKLQRFFCHDMGLVSLDLSEVPLLTRLWCSKNRLASLSLSAVPFLDVLHCACNRLTSLDLSTVPQLTELWCYENQITELDIRPLKNLKELEYDADKTRLIQRPDQNF